MIKEEIGMYINVMNHYKDDDRNVLNKMYPNEDIKDKYILFLFYEFYWDYAFKDIEVEVELQSSNINEANGYRNYPLPKYKIRKPYPNKKYNVVSMIKGNKISELGIPLLFDTFDKLKEINRVSCRWKVNCGNDTDFYLEVTYDLDYENSEDSKHRIYGIWSRDLDINKIIRNMEAKPGNDNSFWGKKFDEYEEIIIYQNSKDDQSFKVTYLKETDDKSNDIEGKSLSTIFNNVSLHKFIENPDREFVINYFYSREKLVPSDCSWMISHH